MDTVKEKCRGTKREGWWEAPNGLRKHVGATRRAQAPRSVNSTGIKWVWAPDTLRNQRTGGVAAAHLIMTSMGTAQDSTLFHSDGVKAFCLGRGTHLNLIKALVCAMAHLLVRFGSIGKRIADRKAPQRGCRPLSQNGSHCYGLSIPRQGDFTLKRRLSCPAPA